ncbi:MAG: hypothetical protein QXF44_03385 [Candidatus Bathyarchaeia archaeon]
MEYEDPYWRFTIKGSPETCIRLIEGYVEAGITHFMFLFADTTELKPLQLFADEVIPAF